jgi:predicted nucleotidyltransferase component of viral defense system
MIVEELNTLVIKAHRQNLSSIYIKSLLKEYLQVYVLNFIYSNRKYNQCFLFTGGTCLRHCFGLNRLSEDLDFDLKKPLDVPEFKALLENYFKKEYLHNDVQISVQKRGSQITLKFPVLRKLNLASDTESDFLYVKIDLSNMVSQIYDQLTTLQTINQFNYMVTHYDLSSLMAGKFNAILTRNKLMGKENNQVVKGRDFFDLLWFLDKKIKLNLPRLNDLLSSDHSLPHIMSMVDAKVEEAIHNNRQSFKQDLLPFINNPNFLEDYLNNYQKNYNINKEYLLVA